MITNPKPFGIPIAQRWDQIGVLFENIETYRIKVVIEIGIYLGGLAELLLLRQQFVPDFHYYGVEFDRKVIHSRILGKPEILVKDAHKPETISEVKNIISQYGTALIYCDGFNKPLEMQLYAPILRLGDLLLVHDFPAEVLPKDLDKFGDDFPYMVEMLPDDHRGVFISLWRRWRL